MIHRLMVLLSDHTVRTIAAAIRIFAVAMLVFALSLMTKREAREIIEAIKAISVYRGTETNKLLAEIKDHLSAIKWLLFVALIVFVSHRLTHG